MMNETATTWTLAVLLVGLVSGLAAAEASSSSSSVVSSVSSSASSDGVPQVSTQISIEGDGTAQVSAVSSAESDNQSAGASISRVQTGSTDGAGVDGLMQAHLERIGGILDDLQRFGFDSAALAQARAELDAQRQAWAAAQTPEQRREVIGSMNAYWAALRQQVQASGLTYDFDLQFDVGQSGGLTVASSSAGSGGLVVTSSQAGAAANATAEANASEINATQAPVLNVGTQADAPSEAGSSTAEQPKASASFAESLVSAVVGAASGVGGAVTAFVSAVARLFG